MRRPKKHTISKRQETYHYLQFNSIVDFHAFCNVEIQQLNASNKEVWNRIEGAASEFIQQGKNWFGTPIPKSVDELENHQQFLGMYLLEKVRPKLKGKLEPYLYKLADQKLLKPKLDYNNKGLGIFSFDRAAMALSKQYAINTSAPIDTRISQMNVELQKISFHTSVKEVYTSFSQKQNQLPAIELYLLAGANAQLGGDQLLYVGLACGELVDFLEQRQIPVQVNVLLGTSFNTHKLMNVVCVKRFQDPLDKNQLLLLASDPRFFRYKGFKSLISISNYFGLNIPNSLGSIESKMGNEFVKQINPKAFVFEQSYSIEAAVREVTTILENYSSNNPNTHA
ncbi:hypothetical protein [Aquimarina agarilytica]|uniref:hypothetical protein n=1 Tax=Aquimarina agarilytica TaxID=1087449 RepID=UPI0002893A27|nr:hypothetical protein [Aquimarina agarilytica]